MLALLLLSAAHASCGLDQCPMPAPATPATSFTARDQVRVTGAPGGLGWYVEEIPSVELRFPLGISVSVAVPVVSLTADGTTTTGLGSTVLVGEWRSDTALQVGGGVQVELPTATHEALGGDHTVLLPYVAARWAPDHALVDGWVGFGAALQHGHSHGVVLVNPHAARELLGRVEVGWRARAGRNDLAVSGLVEPRVGFDHAPEPIVDAGGRLRWVRDRVDLSLLGQAPVTRDRHHDWRTGLSIGVRLGG